MVTELRTSNEVRTLLAIGRIDAEHFAPRERRTLASSCRSARRRTAGSSSFAISASRRSHRRWPARSRGRGRCRARTIDASGTGSEGSDQSGASGGTHPSCTSHPPSCPLATSWPDRWRPMLDPILIHTGAVSRQRVRSRCLSAAKLRAPRTTTSPSRRGPPGKPRCSLGSCRRRRTQADWANNLPLFQVDRCDYGVRLSSDVSPGNKDREDIVGSLHPQQAAKCDGVTSVWRDLQVHIKTSHALGIGLSPRWNAKHLRERLLVPPVTNTNQQPSTARIRVKDEQALVRGHPHREVVAGRLAVIWIASELAAGRRHGKLNLAEKGDVCAGRGLRQHHADGRHHGRKQGTCRAHPKSRSHG